jgi:hypothetical protein
MTCITGAKVDKPSCERPSWSLNLILVIVVAALVVAICGTLDKLWPAY